MRDQKFPVRRSRENDGAIAAEPKTGSAPSSFDLDPAEKKKRENAAAAFCRQTDLINQLQNFSYYQWRFMIGMGPSQKTDEQVLSDSADCLQQYRYLSPEFDSLGTLQYQFLATCESEGIPRSAWPDFGTVALPDPRYEVMMPPFVPPPFDVLRDSTDRWLVRVKEEWSKYQKYCLEQVRRQIGFMSAMGKLSTPVQRRGSGKVSPLKHRLQWAVRHHCSRWSYQRLCIRLNPECRSKDAIIRATQRLLTELGLRNSK